MNNNEQKNKKAEEKKSTCFQYETKGSKKKEKEEIYTQSNHFYLFVNKHTYIYIQIINQNK